MQEHQHFVPNRKKRLATLIPLNGPWRNVVDTASIIIGSFLIAVAFNLFLLPNQIASGGVSGLSILGKEWLGLEPAYTQWAINIPLLIAGFLLIGKQYGIRSVLGSIVLPLFVYLTKDWAIPRRILCSDLCMEGSVWARHRYCIPGKRFNRWDEYPCQNRTEIQWT